MKNKIVLNNVKFDYDLGCKMLKTRYGTYENCPDSIKNHLNLAEIWDDIIPLTFKDISLIGNIEERRVGFLYYGAERMTKELNFELLNRTVLKKENRWLNPFSLKEEVNNIDDVYELYEIPGINFGKYEKNRHFVKCSCTSTGREYYIWVDLDSILRLVPVSKKITAIDAIAWTFTTNVKEESIDYWIRQGDCIFAKIKDGEEPTYTDTPRHLTSKEYINKLKYES